MTSSEEFQLIAEWSLRIRPNTFISDRKSFFRGIQYSFACTVYQRVVFIYLIVNFSTENSNYSNSVRLTTAKDLQFSVFSTPKADKK